MDTGADYNLFHADMAEIIGVDYKEGKKKLDKMPYGILGQGGFFDTFKASFDYKKKEIEVTPKDNSLLTPF